MDSTSPPLPCLPPPLFRDNPFIPDVGSDTPLPAVFGAPDVFQWIEHFESSSDDPAPVDRTLQSFLDPRHLFLDRLNRLLSSLAYLGSDAAIHGTLHNVFDLLSDSPDRMRWLLNDELDGFRDHGAPYPFVHQALQRWWRRHGPQQHDKNDGEEVVRFHLSLRFIGSPYLDCAKVVRLSGDLDLLQRLIDLRRPTTEALSSLCFVAARHGRLDTLRHLHLVHHYCLYAGVIEQAAIAGHWDIVRWSRDVGGCTWSDWVPCWAAHYGRVDMMQWARDGGCPWDEYTPKFAAKAGQLDALIWALENGCPPEPAIAFDAALNGHVSVVRWAKEHGYDCNGQLYSAAARYGHVGVMEYLWGEGVPWEPEAVGMARHNRQQRVLDWIKAKGLLEEGGFT
jgi:hypothetical protein